MEVYKFKYESCSQKVRGKSQVGAVGPRNLEVIIEPNDKSNESQVIIRTGITGRESIYKNLLDRFFTKYPVSIQMVVNDFGNTPGIVELRILEALEGIRDVAER